MWAFQREFVIGEEFHFLFHRADVDVFCHNQEMLLVVTFMFFKTLGFSNVNIYATYIFNIYLYHVSSFEVTANKWRDVTRIRGHSRPN